MKTKISAAVSLLLCTLMISALIISSLTVSALSATVLGDANENGELEISDGNYIQRALISQIKLTEQGMKNAMVYDGESLSITDVTIIQKYLAGLITEFPVSKIISTEETSPSENTEETTGNETEPLKNVDIYFSNNKNWEKVTVYIFNSSSGEAKSEWPGDEMTYLATNEYGEKIYKQNIDLTLYDRIIFSNNGADQTTDTSVSAASSGFFINKKCGTSKTDKWICGLYPYGESDEGITETVNLTYPESSSYQSYSKKITIWLPKDYSEDKEYSVLYMLDGQNTTGSDPECAENEWECDETLISLNKNTAADVIMVGIDNTVNRDSELTPPITDYPKEPGSTAKFTTPTGDVFSSFVTETVMPYIENNYSVNGINGITGSSSGGIEAFYIGIENPDKFSYVGALSPAYLLFTSDEWDSYLSTKDLDSSDMPKIHNYFGNSSKDSLEKAIYTYGIDMETRLKNKGYESSKLLTTVDSDGCHNELFWAVTLPETLSFGLGYKY